MESIASRRRSGCEIGRGVEIVEVQADRWLVQLDHALAHKALMPEVARARMDVHEALILAEHEKCLRVAMVR